MIVKKLNLLHRTFQTRWGTVVWRNITNIFKRIIKCKSDGIRSQIKNNCTLLNLCCNYIIVASSPCSDAKQSVVRDLVRSKSLASALRGRKRLLHFRRLAQNRRLSVTRHSLRLHVHDESRKKCFLPTSECVNSRTNDCNVRIYERDFVEKFLTIVESSHPGKDFSVTFVKACCLL